MTPRPTPFHPLPAPYLDFAAVALGAPSIEHPGIRDAVRRLETHNLVCRLISHPAGDVLIVTPRGRELHFTRESACALSGLALSGGRLLVPEPQPTPEEIADIDPSCGQYSVLAVRDGWACISTDAFGFGLSFVSEHPGLAIASNRLHLHVLVMRALGLPAAPDPISVTALLFSDHLLFAQQSATSRTIVAGVRKVPLHEDVAVGGPYARAVSARQGVLEDALQMAGSGYWRLIEIGVERVAANARAAVESPAFDNVVVELSGGLDTRLVLGSVMHTDNWADRVRVNTRGSEGDPDVEIASGIASLFGLQFFDGSHAELFPVTFQYNIEFWRSCFFGEYHRFAASPWVLGERNRSELTLGGANGEVYRAFWTKVLRKDVEEGGSIEEFASRMVRRVAIRQRFDDGALSDVAAEFANDLAAGFGTTLNELVEDHYLRHRNRSHFGMRGFTVLHDHVTWSPLLAPELFAAARSLPWEMRSRNQVVHDVLARLHPLLTDIPFDRPDPFAGVDRSWLPVALRRRLTVTLDRSVDQWVESQARQRERDRDRTMGRTPLMDWSEAREQLGRAFDESLVVILESGVVNERIGAHLREQLASLGADQWRQAYQLISRVMAVADAIL